jgi:hypothetical protein
VKKAACVLLILLSLSLIVWPLQRQRRPDTFPGLREEFTRRARTGKSHRGEWTFARLRYSSNGWRNMWTTDYPKADEQLLIGLRNWVQSTLDISDDPTTVPPSLDELAKYPFIYAVEPGFMDLTPEHAAQLREYLLRGGFWMLDDFWGEYEWENVQYQLRKVFPEYEIKELPLDHPLFHCYFDINEVVQVPNVDNIIYRGRTDEKGGIVPHYEGISDEHGRLMILIARNCDNGDAWEWIDEPRYPLKYGLAAYRLGMNAIMYAMTH